MLRFFLFSGMLIAGGVMLSGCSIGRLQSDCDENGCNYRKAGVCLDSYTIMLTKDEITKRAYKDIKCRDR